MIRYDTNERQVAGGLDQVCNGVLAHQHNHKHHLDVCFDDCLANSSGKEERRERDLLVESMIR